MDTSDEVNKIDEELKLKAYYCRRAAASLQMFRLLRYRHCARSSEPKGVWLVIKITNHCVLCRFDAALRGDLKQRRVPPKRRHNKHRCGVYISSTKSLYSTT